MKNKLSDLNNYFFEALERVNGAETVDEMENEIKRAKSITEIGKVIIENANTQLSAIKHMDEYGYNTGNNRVMPELLDMADSNENKVHRKNA